MDTAPAIKGFVFVSSPLRFAYAPYQVFKKIGLPSPPVVPFFGNCLDVLKLVSLC